MKSRYSWLTFMDTYTPIFSKIIDSSLWREPDNVVKVFLTMLAKKDKDMIVRGNAYNIACWAVKTEEEVIECLKILSAPDTKRLEPQPFDGRRIEKVEDGWLVLNGVHYQELMMKVHRRAYKAEKQRTYRARKPAGPKRFITGDPEHPGIPQVHEEAA